VEAPTGCPELIAAVLEQQTKVTLVEATPVNLEAHIHQAVVAVLEQ
jgi:hypothetical protein